MPSRSEILVDPGARLRVGRIPKRCEKPELVLDERPSQRRAEIPQADDLGGVVQSFSSQLRCQVVRLESGSGEIGIQLPLIEFPPSFGMTLVTVPLKGNSAVPPPVVTFISET